MKGNTFKAFVDKKYKALRANGQTVTSPSKLTSFIKGRAMAEAYRSNESQHAPVDCRTHRTQQARGEPRHHLLLDQRLRPDGSMV